MKSVLKKLHSLVRQNIQGDPFKNEANPIATQGNKTHSATHNKNELFSSRQPLQHAEMTNSGATSVQNSLDKHDNEASSTNDRDNESRAATHNESIPVTETLNTPTSRGVRRSRIP